jgi:leucyl/phenylalanyl-tRNA--protein transferase
MVLMTDRFHVSSSLQRTLKKVERSRATGSGWEIRFDSAFEEVMHACAAPRADGPGTWISEEIIAAYAALHRQGYAHSAEAWLDGKLVGGAYGMCIGRMFYGESMFARVSDASKIALAYLVHFLKANDVAMIDCQQETRHLASLGAVPISRTRFLAHVRRAVAQPGIECWKPIPLF